MNESFKYSLSKRWTVTDDRLIVGKKEIMFNEISSIKCPMPGSASGAVEYYLVENGLLHFLRFTVPDYKRASDAVDYINECISGKKEPDKYYKKCAVCGHILCYTREELRQNEKYKSDAAFAELGAATHTFVTGQGSRAIQNKMDAQSLESKIRDFSKCPNCNSSDLIDVSEEEIACINAQQNGASAISSADELKKFKELLDMGVITQEEFDAKKKQLLGL